MTLSAASHGPVRSALDGLRSAGVLMARALRRTSGAVALAAVTALALTAATERADAVNIQEVTSPGGIKAWLVEDHSLPLMAMQFAFKGGAAQDAEGKAGTGELLTTLLDEGAGDLDARAFQARVEDLAMRLSFDVSRDHFSGSFQTLTDKRADAVQMLKLALTQPRFDADAIERMRASLMSSLAFQAKDPSRVSAKAWYEAAFGDHPYARPTKGTPETMAAITRDDIADFHARVFARDTLHVGVVGDISAQDLGMLLDDVFGALPAQARLKDVPAITVSAGNGDAEIVVEQMPVPQSVATFGTSAVRRDDPDFVPAYVLNYILGGGGFNSWLMEEVREKRGLAYSVYSYLAPFEKSGMLLGGVATKNEAIKESIDIIRAQFRRMATDGPAPEDLDAAIKHLTGAYALRFDTSNKIASQLLWIQVEDLGIDYIDNRNALVAAVTLEDIKRVAKRIFDEGGLIISVAGQPEGIASTDTAAATQAPQSATAVR